MTTAFDEFDEALPIGDIRALIPDIERVQNPNFPENEPEFMFSDGHLGALLRIAGGNVLMATALACETLGTSEALILKVITTEDLATNGAALMGRYLERARQMRQTAANSEKDDEWGDIQFIPFYVEPAHYEAR